MSKQVLKLVSDSMEALGIEYDFEIYKKHPIVYPYFVGQYTEQAPTTEDGLQESTFMLTGFHRGTWLALEDTKEKIENCARNSRSRGLLIFQELAPYKNTGCRASQGQSLRRS